MSKLDLKKDPSHKGYYKDPDGDLYVFRFGGRPIKVDDYREDKPNEDYNNNEVEIEKSEVIDHRKSASKQENEKFLEEAESEKSMREKMIKKLEGKEDYPSKNHKEHLERLQKDLEHEIDNTKERKDTLEAVHNNEMNGMYYNMNELYDDLAGSLGVKTEEAKKLYNETYNEKETHFAGWELYSDDPYRYGDLRAYNEKMNPKTYTDKLLESERATSNYQKAKAEYDKAWEKYRDVYFNDKDYEKYKSLKDEAQEKYNVARKEAMNKFNEIIPYQELFKTGTEIAGVNTKFTEPIMDEKGYVKYQSEDIRSQCGAFGKVLKECRLTQFNSSISFDEKTNEPFYWGSMDLSYQHNEGGSNGMRIMDYTYSIQNGWEMKDSKGNIYHNGRELKSASELAEYFEGRGYTKETAMNRANELIANRKN